ncbi:MAG TPA: hypothetical protein VKV21_00760 [Solirubrobacteraceae bacterium]|nr:hypothetical protein [Solirubrobacteraceae bacterium]
MTEHESSSRRDEREHLHERAADPADTADRPLEPRSSDEELHATDTPHPQDADPHHRLNTPVGEVDPTTDSDPYRAERPEDDADRASGVRGEGERPNR